MKTNRDFLFVYLHPGPNYLITYHLDHGLTCVFVENKSVWCNQEPLLFSEGEFKNAASEAETSKLNVVGRIASPKMSTC